MDVSLDDAGFARPQVSYDQHFVQVLLLPCHSLLYTHTHTHTQMTPSICLFINSP